jgi:hypothetical protein
MSNDRRDPTSNQRSDDTTKPAPDDFKPDDEPECNSECEPSLAAASIHLAQGVLMHFAGFESHSNGQALEALACFGCAGMQRCLLLRRMVLQRRRRHWLHGAWT